MNRLQKKCILATAGFHLLLLVILLVGPAFFWAKEKEDDTPVLDMIPANLVDTATTGVRGAEPPPPAPQVTPPQPTPTPPAPTPTPPKPTPVVTPPTPAPEPEKEKVEPVKPPKETAKPDLTRVEKPSPVKPTPKINLKLTERTVTKSTTTAAPTPAAPDNSKAIKSALRALRNNLSSSTTISLPGNSSAAAANYAQVVKSVYEQAWTPPDDTASDDADIKVRVTIASDGSVISAKIITPSGDAKVDRSIRSTLERVQFIERFPSGTSDKERSYIINFNLKSKRLLG